MMISMIFPTCKYKEEYKDLAEQRKQLKEKSKARKDAEDFSLVFDKACEEVRDEDKERGASRVVHE